MRKRFWRRLTAVVAAVGMTVLALAPQTAQAEEHWPDGIEVDSAAAVVMEVNTGTVLYEKDSHTSYYPASITKIMTTLLAVENCDLDEVVTFSADAVYKNEGDTSNIARDVGEEMTLEQCLYAVMLESANECAYAVAEHVGQKLGGDYQTFIDLMNTRAEELGCTDTHFNNANGLPDEDHWVSAYDMALIAAEAYRNETFRIIAGTSSFTLPKTNKHDEEYPCHNHHKMLYPYRGDTAYLYDYCTGGKTGYTVAAGSTLVTYAQKDGMTLVCVVLKASSPSHYTDTRRLLDYCFENFQTFNIAENDTVLAAETDKNYGVLNTNEPYVALDGDAYIVMPAGTDFEDATFEKTEGDSEGQPIAQITYTYAGRTVGSVEVVETGASVTETYFTENTDFIQTVDGTRIITLSPVWIIAAVAGLAALILAVFGLKRLYDNFYLMRHKWDVRRQERNRFRETKPKKKRRFFRRRK